MSGLSYYLTLAIAMLLTGYGIIGMLDYFNYSIFSIIFAGMFFVLWCIIIIIGLRKRILNNY